MHHILEWAMIACGLVLAIVLILSGLCALK